MELTSLKQQISYIIGRDLARNFAQQGLDLDIETLAQSLKEALSGQQSRLSPQQMQAAMQQFQQQMAEQEPQGGGGQSAEQNKEEGAAFLAQNKNKAGVQTLPSGLQYEVLQEGSGKKPSLKSSVTTHYHGTLIDGTVFDSSYERGQPATFPVNGVIAGWTEALQLMSEGAKYRLYIPSELAYGTRGAGSDIGPNATLIFDVELLKVNN
ncbi:FKBP-type peptidyl-prolyl cis-trans isomerase [Hymenobacter oligotrophus]|uniref:Peptidyl-prolyl cis-trans isomerase n=1 Tax=Hymenobacter oligotrophus TaxID=2319843 RepID=A0A3B7R4H8_9BACT|nr:FKBP-type peptidyl-prolyl cis-trans isomerase [Hymenobacter oligotrophus]AYA36461.1 FKBP-type peptidyl-prolyl cis-trans isomerase [Hymenobacter oligotrophus]